MQWTFGTFLWSTLILFFWFTVIWMFITVFADVFRRDMSGWAKAGWIVLIVILPFIGILAYMIARPKTPQDAGLYAVDRPAPNGASGYQAADEIAKAARLQDQGKITPDEFEQIKQHALSH
jgi:Phospholipase_D-nuclease N-terminal